MEDIPQLVVGGEASRYTRLPLGKELTPVGCQRTYTY